MSNPNTLNLKKVSRISVFWRNNFGHTRKTKPEGLTLLGQTIPDHKVNEFLERGNHDAWTFVCRLYFTKYDTVERTGEDGMKIRDAFNAVVYSDYRKKKRN